MRKIKRLLKYAVAAALICANMSTAYAQLPETDRGKMGKDWEKKFNEVIKELNLTAEQQKAISEQRQQEKAQSQELRHQIRSVRSSITQELDKDTTDIEKVNSLIAQMKDLTGKRIEQQIQGIIALKKILTPEQFKALNEKRMQDKRHKGGRR